MDADDRQASLMAAQGRVGGGGSSGLQGSPICELVLLSAAEGQC